MSIREHIRALKGKYISVPLLQKFINRRQDYQMLPAADVRQIAIGASKARYGVFPDAFEAYTFNAGESCADLYVSFHLAKRLLQKCPGVHTVLLFYSFYNIGSDLSKNNFKALCPLFSHFYGVPARPLSWSLAWGVRLKIARKRLAPTRPPQPKGYDFPGEFTPGQNIPALAAKHRKQATKYGTGPWQYFLKLRELCLAAGKRLVVVFPPERADYRAALARLQDEREIFKPFLPLGQEIIDARDWMRDADFGDESHLSADGAERFSKKLNAALQTQESGSNL